MVHIDMTRPDRDLTPGVDLWECKSAESTSSRKGDPMLKLKHARVDDPTSQLYDIVMLAGGGWPIGKRKLGAFVEPEFAGDFDPLSIVGARFWIETQIEEYEGRSSLKVNADALKHGGYQRADDPPPGKTAPIEVDDTPF